MDAFIADFELEACEERDIKRPDKMTFSESSVRIYFSFTGIIG